METRGFGPAAACECPGGVGAVSTTVRRATATTLAAMSVLHVAWATGSAFPADDRDELADLVAGTNEMPSAPECLAVATLLGVAAGVVAGPRWLPETVRRFGCLTVASVLGVRAVLGASGYTRLVVPWTPSERFERLDRRYYATLCAALAVGSWTARRVDRGSPRRVRAAAWPWR